MERILSTLSDFTNSLKWKILIKVVLINVNQTIAVAPNDYARANTALSRLPLGTELLYHIFIFMSVAIIYIL